MVEDMKKKYQRTATGGNCKKYKCSKCRDTGLILQDNGRYTVCSCTKVDRAKKLMKKSGVDSTKTFSNFSTPTETTKQMKELAGRYYKNFSDIRYTTQNSIMFCGQSGAGKTHLALALANNFIRSKSIEAIYFNYREVITKIKQNMTDEETYNKILDTYKNAELLVIDDLFKGKITDSDINIMYEIVNYRYLKKLPVIVSTEYYDDELFNFDEAIAGRLYEMAKDYRINIDKNTSNNYRIRK